MEIAAAQSVMDSITADRWNRAQIAERRYWDGAVQDPAEFLRILYDKQVCLDLVQRNVPQIFASRGAERGSVVEIGIGPLGIGIASLLQPNQAWEVTGVEPQPERVCELPEFLMPIYRGIRSRQLTYVQALGEATGLPGDSFDFAFCYNVIDHTPNWSAILDEIHRILKPAAYLVLTVDTLSIVSYVRWAWWQRWARKNDPNVIAHPVRFTALSLERMMPAHGFETVWFQRQNREMRKRLLGHARRLTLIGKKKSPNE